MMEPSPPVENKRKSIEYLHKRDLNTVYEQSGGSCSATKEQNVFNTNSSGKSVESYSRDLQTRSFSFKVGVSEDRTDQQTFLPIVPKQI